MQMKNIDDAIPLMLNADAFNDIFNSSSSFEEMKFKSLVKWSLDWDGKRDGKDWCFHPWLLDALVDFNWIRIKNHDGSNNSKYQNTLFNDGHEAELKAVEEAIRRSDKFNSALLVRNCPKWEYENFHAATIDEYLNTYYAIDKMTAMMHQPSAIYEHLGTTSMVDFKRRYHHLKEVIVEKILSIPEQDEH